MDGDWNSGNATRDDLLDGGFGPRFLLLAVESPVPGGSALWRNKAHPIRPLNPTRPPGLIWAYIEAWSMVLHLESVEDRWNS